MPWLIAVGLFSIQCRHSPHHYSTSTHHSRAPQILSALPRSLGSDSQPPARPQRRRRSSRGGRWCLQRQCSSLRVRGSRGRRLGLQRGEAPRRLYHSGSSRSRRPGVVAALLQPLPIIAPLTSIANPSLWCVARVASALLTFSSPSAPCSVAAPTCLCKFLPVAQGQE